MARPYLAPITGLAGTVPDGRSSILIGDQAYVVVPGPDPAYAALVTAAQAVADAWRTGDNPHYYTELSDRMATLTQALAALAPDPRGRAWVVDEYLDTPEMRAEYERWMRIYNRRAQRIRQRQATPPAPVPAVGEAPDDDAERVSHDCGEDTCVCGEGEREHND